MDQCCVCFSKSDNTYEINPAFYTGIEKDPCILCEGCYSSDMLYAVCEFTWEHGGKKRNDINWQAIYTAFINDPEKALVLKNYLEQYMDLKSIQYMMEHGNADGEYDRFLLGTYCDFCGRDLTGEDLTEEEDIHLWSEGHDTDICAKCWHNLTFLPRGKEGEILFFVLLCIMNCKDGQIPWNRIDRNLLSNFFIESNILRGQNIKG